MVNRVIFGLAAVLMLSACDSSANKACPGAGNAGPGMSVGVHQLATRYPSGIRVTLCVSGECRTEAIGPKTSPSAVEVHTVDIPKPAEMSLTVVYASNGRQVLAVKQPITYTQLEPFGKGCGFEYRSYHVVTSTGTVVGAPATAPPA